MLHESLLSHTMSQKTTSAMYFVIHNLGFGFTVVFIQVHTKLNYLRAGKSSMTCNKCKSYCWVADESMLNTLTLETSSIFFELR